jgi:hypothetical protein
MRHVPAAVKLTTPVVREHPLELESRVIATVRPEDAVAVGV